MVDDDDDILSGPTPITLSQDELDAFVRELGGSNKAIPVLAQEIAAALEEEQPEYFTGGYARLRNGTATVFELTEGTAELTPDQRALSDVDIIRSFLVNPDGKPIREGSFGEGFKKETPRQVGAFGGAVAGAKLGTAMTAGVPPVTPPTIALKFGVPIVTTLVGAIGGQGAVDYFQEKLMGEEDLILPGTAADEEMGKTAATVAGFFATPWAISKNVNFGAAQYLDNLAKMNDEVVPLASKAYRGDQAAMQAITSPAMQEALRTGGQGTRKLRFIRGSERMLSKTAEEARKNPLLTATAEAGFGAGATVGAGFAEEKYEGETIPRLVSETVGGIAPGLVLPSVVRGGISLFKNYDQIGPFFRDVKRRFDQGGIRAVVSGVKEKRLQKATDRLRLLLEGSGEDVDFIIEQLEATGRALRDEAGNPIELTAGAKAGSPTLLAIEKYLENIAPRLGADRAAAAESAIESIRAQVLLMSQSGDREALEASAQTLNDLFNAGLTERLSTRTENLLEAYRRVGGEDERSNAELGQALYDIASAELRKARDQETQLWEAIPEYTIDMFGAERPAFIDVWSRLPSTPEKQELIIADLAPLNKFVNRKAEESQGFETMMGATLSSTELVDMRSVATELARTLRSQGKNNSARIAGEFAEAILEDLQRIPDESISQAYTAAREFSKALNDVYTRAFTGDVLATQRTGAERIPVETLMDRLLRGGADPTLMRIRDLQKVAQFAADEGLEGAEQTMANIDTVYEAMLRSARAKALDPTATGKINEKALYDWIRDHSELLDMFPALRSDLENLNTAQVLLNRTATYNKQKEAKIRRQVNFQNLLGENAESPVFAVSQALSAGNRAPLKSLDNLTRVAMRAPEAEQSGAKKALQGAILEWVMTKGGSTGTRFSPSAMWESLTDPIRGTGTDGVSLLDYMKNKGLMSDVEAKNLDSMLREMIKYEAGLNAGTIDQLAENSGPVFDLFLRISGAKLGTMGSDILGGGNQSLVAAGAGSKAMREVFANIPLALQMDVMLDLIRDPKLLAMYLKKPASEKEKLNLVNRVTDYFKKKGLDVTRRGGAATARELEEDIEQAVTAPVIEEEPVPAPPPPTREPLVQLPPLPQIQGAPQQARPNPQQRMQYAALFPEDEASQMIRGGIGSLG
jgi:hypothetical protein